MRHILTVKTFCLGIMLLLMLPIQAAQAAFSDYVDEEKAIQLIQRISQAKEDVMMQKETDYYALYALAKLDALSLSWNILDENLVRLNKANEMAEDRPGIAAFIVDGTCYAFRKTLAEEIGKIRAMSSRAPDSGALKLLDAVYTDVFNFVRETQVKSVQAYMEKREK